MGAEGERESSAASTASRLTRRLGAPGTTTPVAAAAPTPLPVPAPPEPVAAPKGASGDKVRGSLYMEAVDKVTLMWMVSEVYHDARGATTKHGALGAIIRVVRRDFDRIKAQALAEIHQAAGENR